MESKAKNNKRETKFNKTIKRLNTKRNRIIVIIIIVAIIGVVVFNGFKDVKERNSVFDVTPSYATVSTGDISITVPGDGNLATATSMNFYAQTDLAIEKVMVEPGQAVKEGDVLATLDIDEMADILTTVTYKLNDMQATVDESNKVESTYYVKAPVDGRLKGLEVEKGDLVEDAMADVGYIALIATVDEMKIEITEEDYSKLSQEDELVVRTEGHRYKNVELRRIDDKPYVVIASAYRTIGAQANIYSASATNEGKELATGTLELVAFEYIKGTYGEISYQGHYENYSVDQGEVLFHVDQYKHTLVNSYVQLEALREEYNLCLDLNKSLVLTAPFDGIVTDLQINDDSTLSSDKLVAIMQSTDDWVATVSVDELDINTIAVGQTAVVTIDALDFGDFTATVKSISFSGEASGGITTYDVVLTVEDDEAFKIAMSLTCEIAVEAANNAVLVSSSAVRSNGNISYVLVATERTMKEQNEIKQAILANDMSVLATYMGELGANIGMGARNVNTGVEAIQTDNLPEGMDAEQLENMREKMIESATSALLSNPVELLYAEIRVVEIGLSDSANIEIISGLTAGDQVLLPITSGSSSSDDEQAAAMPLIGMGMGTGSGERVPGTGIGGGK